MLIQFDTEAYLPRTLFQGPSRDYLFGIACRGNMLYFTGCTFIAAARVGSPELELVKMVTPYKPLRGTYNRWMRYLWTKLGADSRVIPYGKPDLHQINIYGSTIYVTATSWNEIWLFDLDLNLKRRIRIQPYIRDYHHLNNVFCDGKHFYVCLNRYERSGGFGGYAKFDQEWNEVERRALGWESHALTVIEGSVAQLCCSAEGIGKEIRHPRRAGMMINETLVFEYDPGKYYCKDFSMDDARIYVVGGENTPREKRKEAAGVVFILNRNYELLQKCVIPGIGGFNGCRLPDLDYSNGTAPLSPTSEVLGESDHTNGEPTAWRFSTIQFRSYDR
jgi:hypothetical protein